MANLWADQFDLVQENRVAKDIIFGFRQDVIRGWADQCGLAPPAFPPPFNEFRAFIRKLLDAKVPQAPAGSRKVTKTPVCRYCVVNLYYPVLILCSYVLLAPSTKIQGNSRIGR